MPCSTSSALPKRSNSRSLRHWPLAGSRQCSAASFSFSVRTARNSPRSSSSHWKLCKGASTSVGRTLKVLTRKSLT
jgi:hypothetical protein